MNACGCVKVRAAIEKEKISHKCAYLQKYHKIVASIFSLNSDYVLEN